jgi:hypothetical protein
MKFLFTRGGDNNGGRKEKARGAKVKQKLKYSSFCNMQILICKYIQLIL